jgi:glutamyl-tRNA reductase
VIGSGTIGRQVTEHLAPFARVTVVYHHRPPDEAFLAMTGAHAVPLERMAPELATSDAVVTAAKFGDRGLRSTDVPRDRPIVMVDLGVPRNIDPDVRSLANVRLIDLAELRALRSHSALEEDDDLRVAEFAERFADRIDRLLLEPWVDAIRRYAEELRRAEVERARPFLGELDPRQEQAVERLTLCLVARLLLAPTERIRSLPPGPEGDLPRRLAVALLQPPASDL